MQAFDYGPVQRLEVLIKRGKGERLISIPAGSARLTFVPNTLGIASTEAHSQIAHGRGVAFTRWHEPARHDFIAVLTGHLRSSSCY
jgi:hypothetical protein